MESWQTPTALVKPARPPLSSRQKKVISVGIVAGVIGLIVFVSSLFTSPDPRDSPSKTWSNGKETCERMVEEKEGQKPRSVMSDVFEASIDTYKMSVWVKYAPENRLYTCRLLWTGKSWDIDLFEYR